MPVPKRKRSKARRDSRFANKGLTVKPYSLCSNCQEAIMPHQACSTCGFYRGRKAIVTKMERVLKRNQVRMAKQQKFATQDTSAKE